MALFKPWTWFQSEERKLKMEELRLKIEEARLNIQVLTNTLFGQSETLINKSTVKPFKVKNIRYVGGTTIAVLDNGEILVKENTALGFYDLMKQVTEEKAFRAAFAEETIIEEKKDKKVEVETEEERKEVRDNFGVLRHNSDFIVEGKDVFFKNVRLPLPASVLGSFIEIEEKKLLAQEEDEEEYWTERYEALKMFWYWTALNPIEASRNDLLSFVKRENISITTNGMLEMYRRIIKVGEDEGKVDFISNNYFKVKKQKKGPANFDVWEEENGDFVLVKKEVSPMGLPYKTLLGNLKELYEGLSKLKTNKYTDNHTRTKNIYVGSVYKEDEDKIDLNNAVDCSNGLMCSPLI